MARCDPWPLNPDGELMLGVKLESPEGTANCEAIIRVPGIAFAEIGPGDLSLSLGYRSIPSEPYPAEMQAARDRVLAACRENGVAFLQSCMADNIHADR
jgi:4-hydroxy-2-oxoheptanedioate aldolase